MNTDFTSDVTELFYDLLDLTETEQQKFLNELEQASLIKHQQVLSLLNADKASADSEPTWLDLLSLSATELVDTSPIDDLINHQVGKYCLTQILGRGGIGVVYSAARNDGKFEQDVAIKFLQPYMFPLAGKELIYREAQVLACLNHPYIAKVYDGGVYQQQYAYIVMEKVGGLELPQYLQQHTVTLREKIQLMIKICQAVQHAHQFQVIHADIKPENILIDGIGNPKLIDFNLCQRVNTKSGSQADITACSRNFASPEQLNQDYLTNLSDIYSLGKLLEWLLFSIGKPLSTDLKLILGQATHPEPVKRYLSSQALADDLQCVLDKFPIKVRARQKRHVFMRFLERNPISSCFVGISLLAIALFITLLVKTNHQLVQEKNIAEDMVYEMTSLLYHGTGAAKDPKAIEQMLEHTRRRILSNPDLPIGLKQKVLLAMMATHSKSKPNKSCLGSECNEPATY